MAYEVTAWPDEPPAFSPQELCWLRALCAGERLLDIAEASWMSERELYRCLRDLYQRLGVAGSHGAVAIAAASGALDPTSLRSSENRT